MVIVLSLAVGDCATPPAPDSKCSAAILTTVYILPPLPAIWKVFGRSADDVWLVKPLTFMNLSGRAVGALLRYYKLDPSELLVIVDEVALEAGRVRLRPSGSAGGHNGLKSIIEHLGTDAFPRLRVGVGRGDPRRDLADHVLSRVPDDERVRMREATTRAADAAECFVEQGLDAAMNQFNRNAVA